MKELRFQSTAPIVACLASALFVAACGSDTDTELFRPTTSASSSSSGSSAGGGGSGGDATGGSGGMGSGGNGGMGTGGAATGGSGGGTGGSGAGGSGGSGTGGSGGTGGGSATCNPEGAFDGAPVDSPAGQWTWVPVPEAKCRSGSSTGFGIRKNANSTKLVIYLEGGGACFNGLTCGQNPSSYGSTNFDSWKNGGGTSGIFSTTNMANSVRDWNFVYVPYCTGDVHSGNKTGVDVPGTLGAPKNQSFVGYANIYQYLRRIIPTFPDVTEVLLTGVSAGGFGAFYNYDRVAQAFCPTPVSLIDDSGPPMSDTYMAPCLQKRWRDLYGFDKTLPADCPECTQSNGGGLVNAWTLLGKKYADKHLGLVSSDKDGTIAQFFGFGKNNCSGIDSFATALSGAEYAAGLNEVRENFLKPSPAWSTYFVNSTSHTYLGGNTSYYNTQVQGTSLTSWVTGVADGAAAVHVGP